jgi:hypothetical protein
MMDERTVHAEMSASRQVGLRRRVKRGIVAGYIHELSARHRPPEHGQREAGGREQQPGSAGFGELVMQE